MNLSEMHVWFRQYAQQMGMQNVRAILPEQIDLLINTSITDTINQLIRENIGVTNDRVITDNSKIGQINALRTLYKVKEINLFNWVNKEEVESNPAECPIYYNFVFNKAYKNIGKLTTKGNNPEGDSSFPNYLYIVDFSISYKKGEGLCTAAYDKNYGDTPGAFSNESIVSYFEDDAEETNWFPVRLIDDAYLADALNDYVLKPRIRTPIIVVYNKDVFDLYIDRFKGFDKTVGSNTIEYYKLQNNLVPYKLRFSYIDTPCKVRYREDLGEPNVDCDLPESMHVDILKHAVDLYHIAITGSLHTAQQQEQNAQQENMRNNYRNEGNRQ